MKNNLRHQSGKNAPRILLVGAGRFGIKHLRSLKALEREGVLSLAGVVLRTLQHRQEIERKFEVPTYPALDAGLLRSVDAVDIATPPETHTAMVSKCLGFVDVFVEKPLACSSRDARRLVALALKHERMLAVGHIYRHHPVTERLATLAARAKSLPSEILGSFLNPPAADQGREPWLELLHLYDVLDAILATAPRAVWSEGRGRVITTHLRYGQRTNARLTLGWQGKDRVRTLSLAYPDQTIVADFAALEVVVRGKSFEKRYPCPMREEPLMRELRAFAQCTRDRRAPIVSGRVGARVVAIAERAAARTIAKPTVAVIGGGIFGSSIAIELARHADVTLFERNEGLLEEASLVNCFRHHRGYHYPRSDETVRNILETRDAFEKTYKKAMVYAPTYYALPKEGSYVTPKAFLAFCKKHQLPYRKERPAAEIFAHDAHALTIRVDEPSYHHGHLNTLVEHRLAASGAHVRLGADVTRVSLLPDGRKKIEYQERGRGKTATVDFVISAMYANINRFAHWMNFPLRPIRIDVAEVLVLRLPIAPVSITVVDGPFACLMPTGEKHTFVLYHVRESILDRYVPADGRIKRSFSKKTNGTAILADSMKFFPILEKAQIVESRVVCRGVEAFREHDDARLTDLIDHGFGCWSVLSGKICSAVSVAERVGTAIQRVTALP